MCRAHSGARLRGNDIPRLPSETLEGAGARMGLVKNEYEGEQT